MHPNIGGMIFGGKVCVIRVKLVIQQVLSLLCLDIEDWSQTSLSYRTKSVRLICQLHLCHCFAEIVIYCLLVFRMVSQAIFALPFVNVTKTGTGTEQVSLLDTPK